MLTAATDEKVKQMVIGVKLNALITLIQLKYLLKTVMQTEEESKPFSI